MKLKRNDRSLKQWAWTPAKRARVIKRQERKQYEWWQYLLQYHHYPVPGQLLAKSKLRGKRG